MKNISILGSTGSIGRNTLEVVKNLGQRFRVTGMAAGRNFELLCKQAQMFSPQIVSLERKEDAERFKRICEDSKIKVVFGPEGAEEVARFEESDIVVSSITGIE